MRILALETSGLAGSVAALEGGTLVGQRVLDAAGRGARTLAPACQTLLADVGWRPADVQLVAVTSGPGSFTGVRIGVTMAKTWAYATGAALIGVHTLEVIAQQTPRELGEVWTLLDAQRQELFVARWVREFGRDFRAVAPTQIQTQETWLRSVATPTAVSGPAVAAVRERIPSGVSVVDESLWTPMASSVGQVAWRLFQAGQRDDPMQLLPLYLRRTAAEEQWERRKGLGGQE